MFKKEKFSQINLLSPSSHFQKEVKVAEKNNVLPFIYMKNKAEEDQTTKGSTIKIKIADKYRKRLNAMSLLK